MDDYTSHPNQYLDQYAGQKIFGAGKAKKYWGGILGNAAKGNFSGMPGMSMFDNAISQGNKDIENSADPLAYLAAGEAGGAMGDRNEALQKERLRNDVNGQRFGFAQQQLSDAAQGITNLANMKNNAYNQKAGTLIGGENARWDRKQKQPGFWSQLGQGLLGKVLS